METLDNKIVSTSVGLVLLKVLFTLLSFIFSLYLIYPTMVLAEEMDNILLPDGKSPKPKIVSVSNGDYISLDEFRREYLPQFESVNSSELVDKSSRRLIVIPGALYVVSLIGTEQYIVQLSKPVFRTSLNSKVIETYISTVDIKTILTGTMLYELVQIDDKIILKSKSLKFRTELPEFAIKSATDESYNQVGVEANVNEDLVNEGAVESVVISDSLEINHEPYIPTEIANNSATLNYSKNNNSQHLVDELVYSILPTAISVINNTREAFQALKPNSQKVLYLEPELLKSNQQNVEKTNESKQDESLPPNLFTVPKGLFRRGIDRK